MRVVEPPFPVVDVTAWPVSDLETAGSNEKVWLENPINSTRALFKPNIRHDNMAQAEDWPEKIASELATLLDLPAARIDLARRDGRRGCLSYDVVPAGWELQPGTVLLAQLLGSHDPMDRQHVGHNLTNIQQVLDGYSTPPGFTGSTNFTAFDVFVGYLMFDALIANRDRHPENWAVLRGPTDGDMRLAPTYDHASGLGFNLRDSAREQMFRDTRMREAFLRKGTAQRFERGGKITLVDFAHNALRLTGAEVEGYWLDRLTALNLDQLNRAVARVPEMSEPARRFSSYILEVNRRRLLDA